MEDGSSFSAGSALRILRPAPSLVLAVLLPLDDAAVSGQKPLLLQERAQSGLIIGQGPADAVAYGTRLTGETAALDRAPHIKLTEPVRRDERLIDNHA